MRATVRLLMLCLALASSVSVSGCAPLLRTSECDGNPAQSLLMAINAVRAREGVPPVRPSALLVDAAAGHARAIADGEASGHFGADGSDPLQRITATGYLPVAFGENVATGSSDPRRIVAAWMASPGHRIVMLDPSVLEIGLAGVLDADPPVWVADFGAGREHSEMRCHPWPTS